MAALCDRLGRPLATLRISVTDRCNFRCSYCMPRHAFGRDHVFLERRQLLSFEEIARVARVAARLGVRTIRLTGGEPLARRDVEQLVELLRAIPGLELAMITNGSLLARKADALARAGLDRITVSLDSLNDATFQALNDAGCPVARVLDGIDAAAAAGLPVKVNATVKRGVNDDDIVPLARRFRGSGHVLRFIEYMDVGTTNGWRADDVVPADEILRRIDAVWPLEPVAPRRADETARRYRYRDGAGEIGVVASVSDPFCTHCSRLRLSPEGRLYACLFAAGGRDLRPLLRDGAPDAAIAEAIEAAWLPRADRYSELRGESGSPAARVEMSHIGG